MSKCNYYSPIGSKSGRSANRHVHVWQTFRVGDRALSRKKTPFCPTITCIIKSMTWAMTWHCRPTECAETVVDRYDNNVVKCSKYVAFIKVAESYKRGKNIKHVLSTNDKSWLLQNSL